MKVRLTSRGLRIRIDDLELAALRRGEPLTLSALWEGGGWTLTLDPAQATRRGQGGELTLGLRDVLEELADPGREGVTLAGAPPVVVEKDFGPQHAG